MHIPGHISPPTGLIGAERALTGGLSSGLRGLQQGSQQGINAIQAGRTGANQFLGQAVSSFDPFASQGVQAGDIQAALSGALGVEAQQQSLANLQPVNQFLQDRGERTVLRNAAALGGLGGGNVQKELVRFGQGLAGQSAQQQFDNLGVVARQGFGALQNQATLRGRQGDASFQAGRDIGNISQRTGEAILGARQATGGLTAAARSRAGEGIAGAVGNTSSALANLVNQQGAGLSDLIGTSGGNLASLLTGLSQQTGVSQEQLAGLLSNLATGQASQVAALPGVQFQQGTAVRDLGTLAGGIGGILSALPPSQTTTQQTTTQ